MPAPAARLFLAGLLIALAPGAWAVELLSYRPDGRLLDLFLDQGRVLIEVDTGGGREFHGVILADGRLGSRPAPDYRRPTRERPIGILPDGIVTYGSRNIAAAWLAGPTDRYDHAVLGDAIEAGEIRARDRRGRVLSARLPDGSVFEDRRVRLADLDGDGGDELVVVRSYPAAGAALSVWRAAGEGLTLVAETPPIGRAYRWLNPAAIADLDGDGRIELAVVVTPHIGGVLKIYRLEAGRLVELHAMPGFSNHAMGSRIQAMAAVVDWPGAGRLLALPSADRRAIRLIRFHDGQYRQFSTIDNADAVVGRLLASDLDGDGRGELLYGLADGRLVALRP